MIKRHAMRTPNTFTPGPRPAIAWPNVATITNHEITISLDLLCRARRALDSIETLTDEQLDPVNLLPAPLVRQPAEEELANEVSNRSSDFKAQLLTPRQLPVHSIHQTYHIRA